MIIICHPLTRQTLLSEYRCHIIYADRKSPLIPIITSPPLITKAKLSASIDIRAEDSLEAAFHPRAGYNLYEYHMDKLVQYICRRDDMGDHAWTAMEDYAHAIGLDIDDLAPETIYKRWQRFCWQRDESIKRVNSLKNHTIPVLKNLKRSGTTLQECIEEASLLIASSPDTFMSPHGQPDKYMLKKATMYIMKTRRWRLEQIATQFGETIPNVSVHISSFRRMIQVGQVMIPS